MMEKKYKKVITGNNAAACAAMLARAQYIAAYPITPQTTIVEYLANFSAGRPDMKFEPVESEHSAMAASIAASAMGLRVFTATSSHGLALMHEMLHWAANARQPIVMVNVNRSLAMPWNINTEQTDSLSQRDTNWLQIYCSGNQEVLDTVIQAFALAETVSLPVMICLDGFLLSHTVEPVEIPCQELVDQFLPPRKPAFKLDVKEPWMFGAHHSPDYYMELRKDIEEASIAALPAMKEINTEFEKVFGRSHEIIKKYRVEDADIIVITNGTTASTAEIAVEEAGSETGAKVGLINLRLVRPFPADELIQAVKTADKIVVLDRSFTSNQGGILAQEIKSAFYPLNVYHGSHGWNYLRKTGPVVYSCIMGLGGRDIDPESIKKIIHDCNKGKLQKINWIGVKNGQNS